MQLSTASNEIFAEPRLLSDAAVDAQHMDIRRIARGALGDDVDWSGGAVDPDLREQRASDQQIGAAGIERIEAHRRPHIPGRHLAEVVVARNAVWTVDPDLAHRL